MMNRFQTLLPISSYAAASRRPRTLETSPTSHAVVGRCSLTVSKPVLKAPMMSVCNQRLKLQYDELLSSFAFKFNVGAPLRRGEPACVLEPVDYTCASDSDCFAHFPCHDTSCKTDWTYDDWTWTKVKYCECSGTTRANCVHDLLLVGCCSLIGLG